MKTIFLTLCAIGIVIFGAIGISIAFTIIKAWQARKKWILTKGKVIVRAVEKREFGDSPDDYILKLEIEFKANGNLYICRDIYPDYRPTFVSHAKANEFMEDLIADKDAYCYYNPKAPEQSSISIEAHFIKNIYLLLSIVASIHMLCVFLSTSIKFPSK